MACVGMVIASSLLAAVSSDGRRFPVGCSTAHCPAELDGYRDGRCAACDCCPYCWTCVELMYYGCAEKLGVTERFTTVQLGALTPGQRIEWRAPASDDSSNATAVATRGWHQCAAFPSLPPGLTFSKGGHLHGALQYDASRPERYAGTFIAYRVLGFAAASAGRGADGMMASGVVLRVELHFDVERNVPPPAFDFAAATVADASAEAEASAAASAAFGAYQAFEQRQLPHSEVTRRMKNELARLRRVLEGRPRVAGGKYWGWLGALHMNVHKLLENMLAECELFLGFALRFDGGGGEAAQIARENLGGCYAKRQLEAAKFLWLGVLQQLAKADEEGELDDAVWAAADAQLAHAAGMKEGWGWGVNNGDIWMARGAVQAVRGRLDAADATLALAHERSADHPWTKASQQAVRELRQAAHDTTQLRMRRSALIAETARWSRQVLQHATPNARPGPLPQLPRLGMPERLDSRCYVHPRDAFYEALRLPMGVPPLCDDA